MPNAGKIRMYTSGWPQIQIRFTYIIELPPSSLVKKWVSNRRSRPSMARVTVRIGNAITIRMLVHSAVQVNTGIFIRSMPGARILTMVTTRLTPDSSVPTPATCNDQM